MSRLLLNLRNVPDDEADEVRALLRESGLSFYETRPSMFGISAGGLWLREDGDAERAGRLLAEYQARRAAHARSAHAAAQREGRVPGVYDAFRADPLRFALVMAGVLLMLALVALPVVLLLR